jgi:hypothetical protein
MDMQTVIILDVHFKILFRVLSVFEHLRGKYSSFHKVCGSNNVVFSDKCSGCFTEVVSYLGNHGQPESKNSGPPPPPLLYVRRCV